MMEIHIKEPVILAQLTTFRQDLESCDTRSVYLFDNPHPRRENDPDGTRKMVIVDNLKFYLFISVNREMSINALVRFMISSYCNSKYGTFDELKAINPDYNNLDEEFVYDETIKKGFFYHEKTNDNVTGRSKETLKRIDLWNRRCYLRYFTKGYHRMDYCWNPVNLHDPVDSIELKNIMIVKDVELLPSLEIHTLPKENQFLADENQYKITFNNHMILAYFLNRFKKPVDLFVGGGKRTYDIKVMGFHRESDIAPARIATFKKPLKDITKDGIDNYIEYQLTILKEDTRKEKIKGDGSVIKTGTLEVVKLQINRSHPSFGELRYGLLHPSYYQMAENFDQTKNNDSGGFYRKHNQPKIHRVVPNDTTNFTCSLYKSIHNEMVKYQSIFINLSTLIPEENSENPIFTSIYKTDIQVNVIKSTIHGTQIATSFQEQKKLKRKLQEEQEKKDLKRVKSSHYNVSKEELESKMVSRRQKSIASFLSTSKNVNEK